MGKLGEKIATEYLKKIGLNFVKSNYHSRYGEIDIIFQDENYIIFIEVKSRSKRQNDGILSIDYRKRRKIVKTALLYRAINFSQKQPRFDVIEIFFDSFGDIFLKHIKNAFYVNGDYFDEIF
jgi:putative endonuclease